VHVGYGALIAAGLADEDEGGEDWSFEDDDYDDNDENGGDGQQARRMARIWRRTARKTRRNVEDLWVAPKHGAVRRVVETWWSRWGVLVFLPAGLVSAFLYLVHVRRGSRICTTSRNMGNEERNPRSLRPGAAG
jgi:hypothetical protein